MHSHPNTLSEPPYAPIVHALIAAGLPAATERAALRLLDRTEWLPSGAGHLALTWDEFCAICGRSNANAARRHLTALARTGLIDYRASDPELRSDGVAVRLTWRLPIADCEAPFAGWEAQAEAPAKFEMDNLESRTARPRAMEGAPARQDEIEMARPRAMEGAPARQNETEMARPRAVDGAPARTSPHTCGDGGGGSSHSPDPEPTTTTNHTSATERRLRMLGLQPRYVRVHTGLSEDEIAAILDAWEDDFRQKRAGTGALLYRLRHGMTPPALEAAEYPAALLAETSEAGRRARA